MGDDITIGVTEVVNNIEVTAQPNDQIIDIDVIDNSDSVTLNVTPTLIEVNIERGGSFARWGTIYGSILDQTDLQSALSLKANLIGGKVPASELPSFVDDVIEVANFASLPTSGEIGKIYITLDNNKIYRWGGSTYVEIAANNAVWGAITGTLSNQTDLQNALNLKADKTITITPNAPLTGGGDLSANRSISINQSGASSDGFLSSTDWNTFNNKQATLVSGTNIKTLEGQSLLGSGNIDLSKSDVGLGNVDNTSDANKPISSATQTALDLKANISGQVFTGAISATNLSGTNTGDQDLSGLVPNTRTLTINGTTFDLSANRSWTINALPSMFEFNETDKTMWNNGKANIGTNTSFGDGALIGSSAGTDNTAIGYRALFSNSFQGASITAIGSLALTSNTTGSNNTAIGNNALVSNSTGSNNISIGQQSGQTYQNISTSIFIGNQTAASGENQTNQIVIGHGATGHGSNTVTLGNGSITTTVLRANVGIGNVNPNSPLDILSNVSARGLNIRNRSSDDLANIMFSTNNGSADNAAIGWVTGRLRFMSGGSGDASERLSILTNGNVGIGTTSPLNKLHITSNSGSGNPTLGVSSGSLFLSGDNNLYGLFQGVNTTTGDSWFQVMRNDSAVAYNLLLQPAGGNISIGTATADAKLRVSGLFNGTQAIFGNVNGRGLEISTSLAAGTNEAGSVLNARGAGSGTMIFQTEGSERMRITSTGNVGIGTTSPTTILDIGTQANQSIGIKTANSNYAFYGGFNDFALIGVNRNPSTGVSVDTSKASASIALNGVNGDSSIRFETSNVNNSVPSERMRITSAGNVGIGTTSPSYTLHVNGSVAGTSAYVNLSDKRYKKDILPIENALDKILALNGVTFNWDKEATDMNLDDNNHIGLLAQDVEEILPQAVTTGMDENETKSVAYTDIVPVLIEAIKEQNEVLMQLKAEIDLLKQKA
jgi:hypothetical protein